MSIITDIKRDYNRSLIYTDVGIKSNPFNIKKETQVVARLGFTKYLDK